MFVLQRDELPTPNQGELIHTIAQRVREYDRVESMQEIDEDLRHAYAPLLKVVPAKVSRAAVLEQLQTKLIETEREMLRQADAEAHLGPPYRYKLRQLEFMDKWIRELAAQIKSEEPQPV
jgi:hypothetical protein